VDQDRTAPQRNAVKGDSVPKAQPYVSPGDRRASPTDRPDRGRQHTLVVENIAQRIGKMKHEDSHPHALALCDLLALNRTRLANERTILAYIRTVIMVVVSAVSLIKLFPESPTAHLLGWSLLPVAAVLTVFGLFRFLRLSQALRQLNR
jgi:putative membrane protein